jgi:hypothetical protein
VPWTKPRPARRLFLVRRLPRVTASLSTTIGAMMHPPRPPSIDQGVVAFIWAIGLGVFIYFGLVAIGASGATSIVLALVSAFGIWLLVRLRGEDVPPRR